MCSSASQRVERGEDRIRCWAHIEQLPGGYWLLVGTDTSEMERSLRRFGWATVWGIGAITALIGLLGRWYATRDGAARARLLRHLRFHRAQRPVAPAGVVGPRGDEYDQLSRTVNEMLERIEQQAMLLRTPSAASRTTCARRCTGCACAWKKRCCMPRSSRGSRELVGPALDELDRVQRTLATLLEIARAEGGSTVARQPKRWIWSQLAHEMFELYAPGMQDKGLKFAIAASGEAPMMGKRQLLAQLIANLLENALKYVPAGGQVWLDVLAGPSACSSPWRTTGRASPRRIAAARSSPS